MTTSRPKKLSDFQAQTKNTNAHTPRGMGMLDHAIVDLGWIGAVTTAADGEIFAGSARHEVACDRFGDEAEPIVVESDGTRPIVVVRTDIPSASDPRAIKLGVADNRFDAELGDLQLIARFDEYKSEHGITEDNEAFAKLLNA